jgi:hypothetical protein
MDPGGKRFSIVEESYFQRAASIHPLNANANLNYAVLLFHVRKDPTTAMIYFKKAVNLINLKFEKFDTYYCKQKKYLDVNPSVEDRDELEYQYMLRLYEHTRIHDVYTRSSIQIKGLAGKWLPVQALWRGHWVRCTVGLSVVSARDKVRQSRIANDARRVLRLALSYHTILLDYELADGKKGSNDDY